MRGSLLGVLSMRLCGVGVDGGGGADATALGPALCGGVVDACPDVL